MSDILKISLKFARIGKKSKIINFFINPNHVIHLSFLGRNSLLPGQPLILQEMIKASFSG